MQKFLRGQIWWCNCSYDVNSGDRDVATDDKQKLFNYIQQGMRPVLIISNDTGNKHAGTLQVIPCTSSDKNSLPTHCSLYINKIKNTFLCEQTRTVNKTDMGQYLVTLDEKEMRMIEDCVQIALGLKQPTRYEKIVVGVENDEKDTIINHEEDGDGRPTTN